MLTAVIAAMLVVGCGSTSSSSTGSLDGKKITNQTGNKSVTVEAVDNIFEAAYIAVSAGTTVTFDNTGRNRHNVISVDDGFESIETRSTAGDSVKVRSSTSR